MASPFNGPTAVSDVIKDLDTQIALIGLGPHNPKKKQDLDKLYDLKAKAQQIMNQFGPSTLINLSNFSSVKAEAGNTPPHSSMANNTSILTKKKLQDLVREVDPNEQLDEDVEEMLLQIADDFIESVVTAACQLARHRKSNTLEVKDVQLHLENGIDPQNNQEITLGKDREIKRKRKKEKDSSMRKKEKSASEAVESTLEVIYGIIFF
ncbi:hypothetical protein E2320_000467 [Naja naja]|nr:hypothetical protein E2320_000467 [Naja naja]